MKVGLVGVNVNSYAQIDAYIAANHPDITCERYMDTGTQSIVRREGKVTKRSIERLEDLIGKAVEDCVDIVILTCTVFSPLIVSIQSDFPDTPIICADRAMIEKGIRRGKSCGLVCTFGPTVVTATEIFNEIKNKLNRNEMELIPYFVEGAADALSRGDRKEHDRLVEEQIEHAERDGIKTIILSQMSISHLQRSSSFDDCIILSSPESAVESAVCKLNEKK